MTRDEQILHATAALNAALISKGYNKLYADAFVDGFYDGVCWADSNPHWHKYPDERPENDGYYIVCTDRGDIDMDCIVTDTLILDDASKDLIAYLKLRIITCALNEGWEPKFEDGEHRWHPYYNKNIGSVGSWESNEFSNSMWLVFKTEELAEYAATQFKDIYMDFCYKGKE